MPNIVMEAMVCKVPMICTNVNGVVELFGEENSGFLLPPADKNKIRDSIINFLNSGEVGYNINDAHKRIKEKFFIDSMINNLESYLLDHIKSFPVDTK